MKRNIKENLSQKELRISKVIQTLPVKTVEDPVKLLTSVCFDSTSDVSIQGATAKGMNAAYAKWIPVHVPVDLDKSNSEDVLDLNRKKCEVIKEYEGRNLAECYETIPTQLIKMEERNIFCGPYNILILQDM